MSAAAGRTREAVERAIERRRRREVSARWRAFVVLAAAALVLDQVTKILVRASLDPRERIDLVPGIDLTRVTNEGIAFGLFAGRQVAISILTVVALCAIAVALAGLVARSAVVAAGAGLLAGGSLGNLLDRLLHGAVTDFIDLPRWPAFNVADCAITIGVVLIVIGLLRDDPPEAEEAGDAP